VEKVVDRRAGESQDDVSRQSDRPCYLCS